jgi:hypothetical protein
MPRRNSVVIVSVIAITVVVFTSLAVAGMTVGPANAQSANTMALDMNITGNTSVLIPSIEQCARIDENGVQDADETGVDTLTVDVIIQGVPVYSDGGTPGDTNDDTGGTIGYQVVVNYPSATFTVASSQVSSGNPPDPTFIVNRNAGSATSDFSELTPDDNADNSWTAVGFDPGTGVPESGDGVLHRFTISTEPGAQAGQYIIQLSENAHIDATGAVHFPTTTLVSNIAVNQACSGLITPSPSPSPSPSPTFPPTPSPSPTPSPTPVPTPSPSPSPSPSPTGTPFPTLTPTPAQTPLPPGFHDARAARLSASQSVDLRGPSTGKITFTIANDGNHFETIGVYLDVIPPADGGCLPAGRLRQTVLNLNPRDKVTLTVDGYPGDPTPGDGKVTFGCSQPLQAEGQNFTFILAVDAHADDLGFCPPNALLSANCLAHRNDDDADGTDNTRIQTAPRVVIR